MPEFKIDNCKYCAAETHIGRYKNLDDVLADVNTGEARCWLCTDDGHFHTDFDVFMRKDGEWEKVWSGRESKALQKLGDMV